MKPMGFEAHPLERFSAALVVIHEEGDLSLKVEVIQPSQLGYTNLRYVVVKVGRFITMFRPKEIDQLVKSAKRVDSLTGQANSLLQSLKSAAENIRDEELSANERSKQI